MTSDVMVLGRERQQPWAMTTSQQTRTTASTTRPAGIAVPAAGAFLLVDAAMTGVNAPRAFSMCSCQIGMALSSGPPGQTSGTSTSRLPTWLAGLTTPCSSICSTSRAALL